MTPRYRLFALGAAGITLAAVMSWAWTAATSANANNELQRWDQARRGAQTLATRLGRLPISRHGAPQPDHVATLARQVLVAAGIGQDALAGIQPLGDSELPGGSWHRQQVLLQLRQLSTRQVAAVVDAVARTDPSWSVANIQLTHVESTPGTNPGDAYDAGLALTTLYPAHP